MSATTSGPSQKESRTGDSPLALTGREQKRMVTSSQPKRGEAFSYVNLGDSARLAFVITPTSRGSVSEQVSEVISSITRALGNHPQQMQVMNQTVFLRNAADRPVCERALISCFGSRMPVTNFVLQPPCCGAALAIEAWAIGGPGVHIQHFSPKTLSITYDSMRWVYCAGIELPDSGQGVYRQTKQALDQLGRLLHEAGSSLESVVRTWFYLGSITEPENETQRYKELNRARTDYYRGLRFGAGLLESHIPQGSYPASTGIGAGGTDLVVGCLALHTNRADVSLVPLENPQQTPAYAYHPKYSPQSPKFSRAMALVLGDYVTTWISGTASIVDSESRHLGDIERQTEQTIDNIERLIAEENFGFHGVRGGGARLGDLAKVRVYLKRPADFDKCKSICDRRFGSVPVVFALADVCRPELLVEIEGVAFSRLGETA